MYIESSYKQLLFGVSQQDYKDRLDGQNEEQINMTSDLTFNLRRRAPVQFQGFTGLTTSTDRLARYETTVSGRRALCLVDTEAGALFVSEDSGPLVQYATDTYLEAPSKNNIRFTTLGDEVFIANTDVFPISTVVPEQATYPDPARHGYFYVVGGQFSKTYNLTITKLSTGTSHTVSYTVPDGSSAGDAEKATPEWITSMLIDQATSSTELAPAQGFQYYPNSAYCFIESQNTDIVVSSDSGSNFIRTSGASKIRNLNELPARLTDEADGYIVGVGTTSTLRYYRWEKATQRWSEDAAYESLTGLADMPHRLRYVTDTWVFDAPVFERRAAGDDESNPVLKFVEAGITGMASFQGRLVILANDHVCMSASNKPLRFFRSTIESLQADDPIEIASTAAQATPYVWATTFNKDLVLWADQYQSIIPGNIAIAPQNASLAVMSQYETRTAVQPVATGRAMFFTAPRSQGFDGVWETLPSEFTDSQLTASDVTNHIPRYVPGRSRFMAASTTSNILVVGFDESPNTLLVHEYLWAGGEKIHHAWHKWEFAWEVVDAWFIGDQMHMLLRVHGELVQAVLDLRTGAGTSASTTGRLDLFQSVTVGSEGGFLVDTRWVDAVQDVWAFKTGGEFPYMKQRLTEDNRDSGFAEFFPEGAAPGDTFVIGAKYQSTLVPTAPSVRDQNGVPITTQRTLIHKWVVTLQDTGEFTFKTSDKYREVTEILTSPLTFGSPELSVGLSQVASGQQYIPARLDMATSRLELSTDDVYDLNITSLEYGFRYHQRYGRRT